MKLRSARHPLRVVLFGGAALCALSGLAGTAGLVAAIVGAALGVVAGELLGGSRLRLWLVLVLGAALGVGGLLLAAAATRYELIPSLLGPSAALQLSAIARFGVLAFALFATLRAAARRIPAFAAVEIVFVAAALAVPFAAHRGGVIARPLWLSDWAWRKGIDPASVLIGVGAGGACLLVLLQVLEAARRRALASLLALPALALLIIGVVHYAPTPKPSQSSDLGSTKLNDKIPPPPKDQQTGQNQPHGGNGNPQGGTGGGQGGNGNGGGAQPQPPDLELPSDGNKDAPMAVVLLGDDYTPSAQGFYFRQEAWSDFVGKRLVAPRRSDVDLDVPRGFAAGRRDTPRAEDETGGQVLHADVAMLVTHRTPFFLGAPTEDEPLANPDPARFVRAYHFESVVHDLGPEELLGHGAGDPAWTTEQRDYYLRAPDDPRFAELAQQILAGVPERLRDDPFARAAAIKLYLDKHLTYSTKARHAGVPDPVADFLFGDRIGYCAHAAVYLFRSLGVPARIGVGYMVDAESVHGAQLLIRGKDAHAWPEIYLAGVGWTVLDIAAEKNLDPPGTPPDDDLTILLANMARKAPPDPSTAVLPPPPARSYSGLLVAGILGLALCVLVSLYGAKLWRRLAPRLASPRALPRVGYRLAVDLLAEIGPTRGHGETREHFARRVGARFPALGRITELHVAARFAAAPGPRQERSEWRDLLAQLRAQRGAATSTWRRVLAAIDPWSFLTSR